MAKLSISDAARACCVARSTLQRAINAGRLSLDPDHRIDTAELLRAGFTLHAARQPHEAPMRYGALQDAAGRSSSARQPAAVPPGADAALLQHTLAALERENTLLHAALDAAAAREEEARANTQAAREREALLLQMLQDMQHRYDRLLDMPRTTVPPQTAEEPPGATQTREPLEGEGDSHAARHSHRRRRGIPVATCTDALWPCSENILQASALPRYVKCSAQSGAWRTRA